MKKYLFQVLLITLILSIPYIVSANIADDLKDKGKAYYTREEIKSMCGAYRLTQSEFVKLKAQQDSMYAEYKKSKKGGVHKIASIPDWKSLMSPVEVQGCGNCWAHASTGLVEGLLHSYHGSNIGIDLSEMDIVNNNTSGGDCDGGLLSYALYYMKNSRVLTESDDDFPNYDNTYYSVTDYSTLNTGISAIKTALNSSPVAASFELYEDFSDFCNTYPDSVYRYDGVSDEIDPHAIVIVDYNDDDDYWVCKNSWGTAWGDDGYFKIGYGECLIEYRITKKAIVSSDNCFAKITPGLIDTLDDALDYDWATGEWAYINSNYSLPSSTTVTSDGSIEVISGATFTVGSNSTIEMANGKDIEIENGGTLSLSGDATLTKKSGGSNWGKLDINSTGTLSVGGCLTVDYAETVYIFGNNITFPTTKGYIKNCTMGGMYVWGGTPTIRYLSFEDNSGHGILTSGGSTDPTVDHVTISDSAVAIKISGSGDMELTNSLIEANSTHDSITLYASTGGIDLDYNSNDIAHGLNRYAINNYSGTSLYARSNDWGASPDEDDLFAYPANVTWSQTTVTGAGAGKIAVGQLAENTLKKARDREELGNWSGALETYYAVIESDENLISRRMSIKNILRLNQKHDIGYDGIREVISNELKTADSWYKASLDFLMCETYLSEGNVDEAISAFEDNASKYSGTSMEVESLVRLAIIHADYKRDKEKALGIANRAAAINPGQEVLLAAFVSADADYDPSLHNDKFEGITEDFGDSSDPKEKPAADAATDFFSPSPNPFNPATTLSYSLANPGHVSLHVYNSTGQKVATLVDTYMSAGEHSVKFDGRGMSSGMYFYRFEAGEIEKTGRMTLIK
jgi:hypothetical protein